MQVPLSGDNECLGGQLVFASPDDSVNVAARVPGVPIFHHGHEVHGVTALLRGVRWGCFLLQHSD